MRDIDGYREILALIEDSGAFGSVLFGRAPNPPLSAASHPFAWIEPDRWQEADTTDPAMPVREVRFRITIGSRAGDPLEAFDELDQLAQVLTNALGGQTIAGGIGALSQITGGSYLDADLKPRGDEVLCRLSGSFAYLTDTPGDGGRDEQARPATGGIYRPPSYFPPDYFAR